MKKYNDLLIRQTDSLNGTDGSDNVQPATKVWIVNAGTRNLAYLYDGEDINTANQISNPITTDSYGRMSFYIDDGDYDFYINFNTDIEFKVKSSEPIYDVKGATVGFNHSVATNRSDIGAHDDIYNRRYQSLSALTSETRSLEIGATVTTGTTTYRIVDGVASRGILLASGVKALPLNGLFTSDCGVDPSDSVTDYSSQLNSAIQLLSDSGGGAFICNSKINIGTTTVVCQKGVAMRGVGQSVAQYLYSGAGVAIEIKSTEDLGVPTNDARPHTGHEHYGFSVVQIGPFKTGTGIWNKHNTRATIRHVGVKGFDRGIDCAGACWINKLDTNWIVLCRYGFWVGATDGDYREPTDPSFAGITFSGLNASGIVNNEIQACDYGVYSPAYTAIGSASVAAKLKIDNNSIEGGGQAVQFTPNNAGLTISNNYTEVNGVGMTIDPLTDPITDINLVKADYVQNKFAGSPAQVGLNIHDNHQIVPSDNILTYIDRAGAFDYRGNDGFNTSLVIKQRSLDYDVGPYTIESNTGAISLDGPSKNNSTSQGNSALENFIGASIQARFLSPVKAEKGIDLSPAQKLPVGTTTPAADLANIPDNTFYFDFVSGTGYPDTLGATQGSLIGYKNTANDYGYCWQEYVSSDGTKYRRIATSASVWGAFLAV